MSMHYTWGNMNPENCLFIDSGKLGIRREHQHRRIEMKYCVVGVLQDVVKRFEFHQNRSSGFGAWGRNLPFFVDLAIGLYKIVISQQIKEAISNGHEKLTKLMIAQTPQLLPAKNY